MQLSALDEVEKYVKSKSNNGNILFPLLLISMILPLPSY